MALANIPVAVSVLVDASNDVVPAACTHAVYVPAAGSVTVTTLTVVPVLLIVVADVPAFAQLPPVTNLTTSVDARPVPVRETVVSTPAMAVVGVNVVSVGTVWRCEA